MQAILLCQFVKLLCKTYDCVNYSGYIHLHCLQQVQYSSCRLLLSVLCMIHFLYSWPETLDCTPNKTKWKGGSDTSSGLVEKFWTWANCNSMSCNPNKRKELVIKKKWNSTSYPDVRNIPQHATLKLLGLTFQNDCKFFAHIKAKLCKANKCLHALRVCRKERYSQTEIGYLFYRQML